MEYRYNNYMTGILEANRVLDVVESSPVFIPRKHPKQSYANHKRTKKRKSK